MMVNPNLDMHDMEEADRHLLICGRIAERALKMAQRLEKKHHQSVSKDLKREDPPLTEWTQRP
jgi:hypothetical protein